MNIEIERKFLLKSDAWKKHVVKKIPIRQRYLAKVDGTTVRVRIAGDEAFLTVKDRAPAGKPLNHPEFEYAIPLADAEEMMKLCLPGEVVKTRHIVFFGGKEWEIDIFEGKNAPLVVAEIELTSADEKFARPPWLGKEVTSDRRYKNARLAEQPYSAWGPPSSPKKSPGPS